MLQNGHPPFFPIPFANGAGPSYVRAIPTASSSEPGAASLTDGFPPVNFQPVGAGGIPPDGRDMNGILLQITNWIRWLSAGGVVKYDAAFAAAIGGYPAGALLAGNTLGSFWMNAQDGNTTDPDSLSAAHWFAFPAQTASNDFSGLISFIQAITTKGGINATGQDAGGANLRLVNGNNPAVILRNDGESFYVQLTNANSPQAQWNALIPFQIHTATGKVTFDTTGAGVLFGGAVSVTGRLDATTAILAQGARGTGDQRRVVTLADFGRAYTSYNNGYRLDPDGLMDMTMEVDAPCGGGIVTTNYPLPTTFPNGVLDAMICFRDYAPPAAAGNVSVEGLDASTVAVTTNYVASGTVPVVIRIRGW